MKKIVIGKGEIVLKNGKIAFIGLVVFQIVMAIAEGVLTYISSAAACTLAFIMLEMSAFAAPSANVEITISDAVQTAEGIIFTADIDMDSPSEPYASLDFYLVSSDSGHLSIIETNAGSESPGLDITFTEEYGGAYHNGRFDKTSGEGRYLIGIYGKTSGNVITDATHICSVRMLYTGEATQTLSIRDMKLVYKDADGVIAGAPITGALPSLGIDATALEAVLLESEVPMSDLTDIGENREESGGALPPLLYVLIGVAVTALLLVIVLIAQKKRSRASAR